MDPNFPALPQQIPALPAEGGGDDADNFFVFPETLEDIFNSHTGFLPSSPPPPLPPADDEFDFDAIMDIVDPLPDAELSSWYSSVPVPVPPNPDLVQSLPVEFDAVTAHNVAVPDVAQGLPVESNAIATENVTVGDVRGDSSGGVEGSAGRKHSVGTTSGGGSRRQIRKAMTNEMLEELFRVDPKKANRILANRKSAARSKARQMMHAMQIEENVKALEIQLASIDLELETIMGENRAITARNNYFKMGIDDMKKELQIQEARNEILRNEVEQLRIEVGDAAGDLPYDAMQSQYPPHHQIALHQLPTPPPQYMVPQQPQFGFDMRLLPPQLPPPQLPPPQLPPPQPSQPSLSAENDFVVGETEQPFTSTRLL